MYRAGKAVEVDVTNSGAVDVVESEKLLKQLKVELALLEGRTSGKSENAARLAYGNAAEAYQAFINMRSLDPRGDAIDGRMLVGDGWVPVASKFHFAIEQKPAGPGDNYKWYWVNVGESVTALLSAVKGHLGEANGLVHGSS